MARMMNRTMMMTAMAMFSFILSFSFLYVLVVIGVRTDVLNVRIAPGNTDVACILGHDMV